MSSKFINYNTKDSKGNYREQKMIGTLWMHSGNNKLYTIIGYVWNCVTDEWDFKIKPYFEEKFGDQVEYTRSIENFHGQREGKPRFIRVTRESFDNEIEE